MPISAGALIVSAVDTVALGKVTIPDPGPGQVLVRLTHTAISPGTEARVMKGLPPNNVGFPFVPGYSGSGVVERTCTGGPAVGTVVHCAATHELVGPARLWGGHVSHAVMPMSAAVPVPAGCDPIGASLAHLAAIAYHGVRLARPVPGERVAVIGLGPIGLLSALIHRAAGVHLVACDRSAKRVERARALGLEALVAGDDLAATFAPIFPAGADVVVDATGAPAVLAKAVEVARPLVWGDNHAVGARLVIQGSYAADVALPYHATFMRELTVLVPRDRTPGDVVAVLELSARGLLPLRELISHIARPEEASAVYTELRRPDTEWVTAAFAW